jgi:hypothetical protein
VIVVVESPCKPSDGAVAALRSMTSSDSEYNRYIREAVMLSDDCWASSCEEIVCEAPSIIRLRNTFYARAAMLDALERGEAPFLSHLLYTQVYDDDDAEERRKGMEAGIELSHRLLLDEDTCHVFYVELGVSSGMKAAAKSLFPDAQPPRHDHRQLGPKARTWYLARVPASIAWLV